MVEVRADLFRVATYEMAAGEGMYVTNNLFSVICDRSFSRKSSLESRLKGCTLFTNIPQRVL